jgi:hypothetical protein
VKTYFAKIIKPGWIRTTCTVDAADYTAAFLAVTYRYPLKTIIIELKEIKQ